MANDYVRQQKIMVDKLEKTFASKNPKPTVVNMQKDYVNDDQMCLTSAVFIPDKISKKIIEKIVDPLRAADVKKVRELYTQLIPQFSSFEFHVEDAILFPTSLSVMAYSDDAFKELFISLDKGLKEFAIPALNKLSPNMA